MDIEHGIKAEKLLAKRLKMRLTPASGALGLKGDMKDKLFLAESKSTNSGSMALKYEWLIKISQEARLAGARTPVVGIQFVKNNGQPRLDGAWVMVSESFFSEILELCEERDARSLSKEGNTPRTSKVREG